MSGSRVEAEHTIWTRQHISAGIEHQNSLQGGLIHGNCHHHRRNRPARVRRVCRDDWCYAGFVCYR